MLLAGNGVMDMDSCGDHLLFIVPPTITYDKFVNPPKNVRTISKQDGRSYGSALTEPLIGVVSLSAYVKKFADVETSLVDFNVVLNKLDTFEYDSFRSFFRHYLKGLHGSVPNVVGISTLFTTSYFSMIDIAEVAKEIWPEVIVIAGGGVPTAMYREIHQDSSSFDGLFYGEGERSLLLLLQSDDKRGFLERSPSIITRNNLKMAVAPVHDFIEDLDEIPPYDYGLLNIRDYRLNSTIAAYPSVDSEKEYVTIMSSRGCPFRCTFCASHSVHGRKMRFHSVDRVKSDIEYMRKHHGAEVIIFQDDHLMADKDRVHQILDFLDEHSLTPFFPNALAIYALDRTMLEALKRVGVDLLVLPVESGSSRILKEVMKKPLKLSIVNRVVDDCRDLGIDTDVNILIGMPGETKEDIEDTRKFLRTLDATWFRFYAAMPAVGSEMHQLAEDNGYLVEGYLNSDYKSAVIETEDFSADYIQEILYDLNLDLNFVSNSSVRLGEYSTALQQFENTIRVARGHAFAYYYSAICSERLGQYEKFVKYKEQYEEILKENSFWQDCAKRFKLTELTAVI